MPFTWRVDALIGSRLEQPQGTSTDSYVYWKDLKQASDVTIEHSHKLEKLHQMIEKNDGKDFWGRIVLNSLGVMGILITIGLKISAIKKAVEESTWNSWTPKFTGDSTFYSP